MIDSVEKIFIISNFYKMYTLRNLLLTQKDM